MKRLILAIVIGVVLSLGLPVITLALTHLGGLTTEPLIGSASGDNNLLITAGDDTMLVLSTTYEAPPETPVSWNYLDNLIAIALAVAVCMIVFKTTKTRYDKGGALIVLNSLKEKNLIMVVAGAVTYAMVILILRSF